MAKGEVEEALALFLQELEAYETLGERHAYAVTLGDIARLLAQTGEVDLREHKKEALRMAA